MTPRIMGIVNVTPDSFSDGGQYVTTAAAVAHALRLLDEGADLVDVGGESTRPGAEPVPPDAEAARVVPVVEGILEARPGTLISIDTRRASVAAACLEAGARWVNDVAAGRDPDMAAVVRAHDATWVLMHMRGEPRTMQEDTAYDDVVAEVEGFLVQRVAEAVAAGVPEERLWVDAGLGFGKAMVDNPRLVAATGRLHEATGCPVLVGASRKRFLGHLLDLPVPADRVHASVGVAVAAAGHGAGMVRVHDVAATRHALVAWAACQ